MIDSTQQIQILQILYEIAMSIGVSLDLRTMLKACLPTFLKKLNCSAGGVYHIVEHAANTCSIERIYSIPQNIENSASYQAVRQQIPMQLTMRQLADFRKRLPVIGHPETDSHFYLLELPNFGVLTLVKNGDDLDPFLVKSLTPLCVKLAAACTACFTEKARIEEHNLLRALIANMPDFIYVKDREGRFLIANEIVAQANGVGTLDRLLGKTDFDLFPPELAQQFYADEQAVIESDRAIIDQEELVRDHSTGQPLWLLTTKVPFRDSQGNIAGVMGIGRNITARKQAEEALKSHRDQLEDLVEERTAEIVRAMTEAKRLNEELRREIAERQHTEEALRQAKEAAEIAQRASENANRAKSEFLANMSHEIRTPMNALLGFTELLDALISDPQQKGYLDSIKTSGRDLLSLINDILDLSKIESGKLDFSEEPVNLRELLRELAHMFQIKLANKGLEWQVEIAPALPEYLLLDELRIRQVLFNLIGNAIKFTDTGKISVRVHEFNEFDDLTNSPTRQPANPPTHKTLVFKVEDSGIGIPADQQELIFEAFRQQDGQSTRKYGGTGLGLAITRRLVNMMGGTISVTSELEKGTCFKVLLPHVAVAGAESSIPRSKKLDIQHVMFEPATVLLVDDVPENRRLLKEYLRATALTIIEAENGQQAVQYAQQYQPDLILMDLLMPVMDGYEALTQIKDLRAVPVIALTASVMKKEQEKIKKSGFEGFLLKPITRIQLLQEAARFLPHSIVEIPTESSEQSVQDLSPESREHLPELLEQLEEECMELWDAACQSNSFEDIKAFGTQINVLGTCYSLSILQTFGDRLLAHARNFDVEQMTIALKSYPAMVEEVRNLIG